MKSTPVPFVALLIWPALLGSPLRAERAPLAPSELVRESDLVIVGRILDLEVEPERSHVERGFGNYDWAIDVTIAITDIEKGRFEGSDRIVARCFRIKSRRSITEYLTPSGNYRSRTRVPVLARTSTRTMGAGEWSSRTGLFPRMPMQSWRTRKSSSSSGVADSRTLCHWSSGSRSAP